MTEGKHFAPRGPAPDDPYRDCAVYLEHGACVCSTGYPSACQMAEAEVVERERKAINEW